MNDLIEALQIFAKYTDTRWPTHCEHDTLTVCVDPADVSEEDKTRLRELSFRPGEDWAEAMFQSARFGSA